jgi:hypothetical protein
MLIEPHMEGIVKEFSLKDRTKQNLYLIKIMIESMMSLNKNTWEIGNPPNYRLPGEPNLFKESTAVREENRKKAIKFYDNFLQLDEKHVSEDARQDMWANNQDEKAFGW